MTERKRITFVGRDSCEWEIFIRHWLFVTFCEFAELPVQNLIKYWCSWICANWTYWM